MLMNGMNGKSDEYKKYIMSRFSSLMKQRWMTVWKTVTQSQQNKDGDDSAFPGRDYRWRRYNNNDNPWQDHAYDILE